MITAARNYTRFLARCFVCLFEGDWRYYLWVGVLTAICAAGLNAYARQYVYGLATTGMTDQVSWGVYIANFTFLVGVAAAAVMMVIPVYIYDNEELHDLVIFGELLAVAAIIMCLAFVTVDLGRPDRFWHLLPGLGRFNFPVSMLTWDVIVLNGYLLLNLHIAGYLLYCRYQHRQPTLLEVVQRLAAPALALLAMQGCRRQAGRAHPRGRPQPRRARRARRSRGVLARSRIRSAASWVSSSATLPDKSGYFGAAALASSFANTLNNTMAPATRASSASRPARPPSRGALSRLPIGSGRAVRTKAPWLERSRVWTAIAAPSRRSSSATPTSRTSSTGCPPCSPRRPSAPCG